MPTTPIIESLGRSLDHWQFLYILAITVALLSTFAIVIFAFHIEQHKAGLKTSNYIYVVASLLAVVASIVIVVKTKSLDSEKDRVAGVEITRAKAEAFEADAKAETAKGNAEGARQKAEEARENAEIATQKAEAIHAKAEEARQNSLRAEAEAREAVVDKEKILHDNLALQKQVEDERTARVQIEARLAPRNLTKVAQNQMIEQLRRLHPEDIDFVSWAGNSEAQNLLGQIAYAFQNVGWKTYFFTPMGGSGQGVAIEYEIRDKEAKGIVDILAAALANSGIQITSVDSNLPSINNQLGAYSSSNGASGTGKVRIFVGSK